MSYHLRRYHARRAEAIKILGGKCVECGTVEELEIDHINPATKEFPVGAMWGVARAKYLKEIQKCQLLCKTHHTVKTTDEQAGEHGSRKRCKCVPCVVGRRERMRLYMREYRKSKPR